MKQSINTIFKFINWLRGIRFPHIIQYSNYFFIGLLLLHFPIWYRYFYSADYEYIFFVLHDIKHQLEIEIKEKAMHDYNDLYGITKCELMTSKLLSLFDLPVEDPKDQEAVSKAIYLVFRDYLSSECMDKLHFRREDRVKYGEEVFAEVKPDLIKALQWEAYRYTAIGFARESYYLILYSMFHFLIIFSFQLKEIIVDYIHHESVRWIMMLFILVVLFLSIHYSILKLNNQIMLYNTFLKMPLSGSYFEWEVLLDAIKKYPELGEQLEELWFSYLQNPTQVDVQKSLREALAILEYTKSSRVLSIEDEAVARSKDLRVYLANEYCSKGGICDMDVILEERAQEWLQDIKSAQSCILVQSKSNMNTQDVCVQIHKFFKQMLSRDNLTEDERKYLTCMLSFSCRSLG